MKSTYHFSSDDAEIDRTQVHLWLSEESYWAKGRSRATQDQAIDGSRNFGVYETSTGRQVAYARVVTDGVTFAWLCDLFVMPDVRGQGIGVALMEGIIEVFEPLSLKRMLLSTGDAHGLYAKFGFEPLDSPSKWMQRTVQPAALEGIRVRH
ncbi:GNAT superfamily N-acetyltransferase [Mycetocola sp. CAN_C7]|uniref:GNAT family N-acetyltransferase n=1 Tax=Mycetocola sp. CAN_C7 TaxID=2787724 RepID=UPI0018CBA7D3